MLPHEEILRSKYLNLFVRVREGSDSAHIWGILKRRMVQSDCILREGLAPTSNVEREIEKNLEHLKTRRHSPPAYPTTPASEAASSHSEVVPPPPGLSLPPASSNLVGLLPVNGPVGRRI